MSTTNVNLLSQSEWRQIHNSLSLDQLQAFRTAESRAAIQTLMEKIRDNYIESEINKPDPDYP